MRDSKTSVREIGASTDAVAPHALADGSLRALQHMPLDNNAPAGAILSSVDDMSRWVMALLNKGALGNGKRLFSERQARILWTPLTILPINDAAPELADLQPHFIDYAMGEVLRDYPRTPAGLAHGRASRNGEYRSHAAGIECRGRCSHQSGRSGRISIHRLYNSRSLSRRAAE
jgi:CubicO group peptidase (beta-lactamase class C family)